jgi:putative endonuclease
MYICYILYSPSLNKYYVGISDNPELRLHQHNNAFFRGAFTIRANDWQLYLLIPCIDYSAARRLELQIKMKKSRKFIERLKTDPDLFRKLLAKI